MKDSGRIVAGLETDGRSPFSSLISLSPSSSVSTVVPFLNVELFVRRKCAKVLAYYIREPVTRYVFVTSHRHSKSMILR